MGVWPRRSRRWPRVEWPIRSKVTGRAGSSRQRSRTSRSSASEAACRKVTHRTAAPAKNSSAQSGEATLSGTGGDVSVADMLVTGSRWDFGVGGDRPGGGGGQCGGEQVGGACLTVGRGRCGGGERRCCWCGGQGGGQWCRGGQQGGRAPPARPGRTGLRRGGAGRTCRQIVTAGH